MGDGSACGAPVDEVLQQSALDNPLYFEEQAEHAANEGYMAVEPDWLSEQWDLLSEQDWYASA